MSYSAELREFIVSLRGGPFFLSPREKIFLDLLEDMGIPEEVVKEGIELCLGAVEPRKRSKYPLFLCMSKILDLYESYRRHMTLKDPFDWRERFNYKINLIKDFLEEDPPVPQSEEEAERILSEIESAIIKDLWNKLDKEEKERILSSVKQFRKEDDIYKELIKREIRRIYGIPTLSLYID